MTKRSRERREPIHWFPMVNIGVLVGFLAERHIVLPRLPKEMLPVEPYITLAAMGVLGLVFLSIGALVNRVNENRI